MRTFGTAVLKKTNWHIQAEPHVILRLKRFFGAARGQVGTIKLRNTDEVCRDLLWFMQRYPLEVDPLEHLQKRAEAYDRRAERFAGVLTGTIEPRAFKMALPPREYQRIGAELALQSPGLLIADDVGLGKTCTAIAALTDPATRPALVVTLTHLPIQWQREIERFAPGLEQHVIKKGTPYDVAAPRRRRAGQMDLIEPRFPDVLICNYHKLAGWAETLAGKVRSVVFDECQELRRSGKPKEPSKKYAAAKHIAEGCNVRVGLSATPIYNFGGEMWNIMQVLRPGALGNKSEFQTEWCKGGYGEFEKAALSNPKAFGSYLREQGMMIRRTREDVGRELPELVKVPHHVSSDPKALEALSAGVAELARMVLQQGLDGMTKRQAAGELDWRLRQATGVAKAPYVAEFVRLLVEGGAGKVVLFGWHREVYGVWLDKLKALKPQLYTGSESPKQKRDAVDAFTKGDCQVLIISLRSGAGLDGLQGACNTVVFGELDWSPGVHEQCAGRVHRDGQRDSVVAYYLQSDSGSDPVVAEMLGLKAAQARGVRDPDGGLLERLESGTDRLKSLAEAYLLQRGEKLPEPVKEPAEVVAASGAAS